MKREIGTVVEVFIPKEESIDIMYSNQIGFKVQLTNGIITIIQEQNEENASILKDDIVMIITQIIQGKKYTEIKIYEGDDYE